MPFQHLDLLFKSVVSEHVNEQNIENLTTTKFLDIILLMIFMYLGHLVPVYSFVQDELASGVGG